jgi:hypothetical protein
VSRRPETASPARSVTLVSLNTGSPPQIFGSRMMRCSKLGRLLLLACSPSQRIDPFVTALLHSRVLRRSVKARQRSRISGRTGRARFFCPFLSGCVFQLWAESLWSEFSLEVSLSASSKRARNCFRRIRLSETSVLPLSFPASSFSWALISSNLVVPFVIGK